MGKTYSFNTKITCTLALNIMMMVASVGVAYWGISSLIHAQQETLLGGEILNNHLQSDMMHDALRGDVLSILFATSDSKVDLGNADDLLNDLKEHSDSFRSHIKANAKLNFNDEVSEAIKDVGPLLESYISSASEIAALAGPRHTEALQRFPNFLSAFSDLESKMEVLSEKIDSAVKERANQAAAVGPLAYSMLGLAFVVALLVAAASVFFINRSVTRLLREIVKNLDSSSVQLLSSSSQIAAASQALAQRATEQAASLEETAASLEEISSVSKHNTDNSRVAFQLADSVRVSANDGMSSMKKMTDAIYSIRTSAEETALIVRVIDEIAFQTNLLALNAAVEAARAGDAGKGFAVVAEEVRSLAQRSANAAKESAEKIRHSKELAENGVKITEGMASSLELINQNAVKTSDLMKEIAAASDEQSAGIAQVNIAVTELDKVTQQNSAAAEESSASGEELSAQAHSLAKVVADLTTLVSGGTGDTSSVSLTRRNSGVDSVTSEKKRTNAPVTVPMARPVEAAGKKPIALKSTQIIPLDDSDFQGF